MEFDDFLSHYGVKGMKWGVRRSREQLARAAKARKSGDSPETAAAKKSRSEASKNRRQLSDDQLNGLVNRLETERKLKNLVEEDISPGKAAVRKIASDAGQRTAKAVATGAAAYTVKAVLEKKFDTVEAVRFVTPRNPNRR